MEDEKCRTCTWCGKQENPCIVCNDDYDMYDSNAIVQEAELVTLICQN